MASSPATAPHRVPATISPPLPCVTAIVVTHNARPHIDSCLQSLLAANGANVEALVVDNASTDGTVDYIRQKFPDVRIIAVASNLGYGRASNLGACTTQAEYIAVVNQDVISTTGWINALVAALEADDTAALATPKILLQHDPQRINTCGNAPHYTGITPCRGYDHPATDFPMAEEVAAVSGAAFVARRAVFEALGGFDPRFFLYLEDTELSLRAHLAGHRCLYVPDSVVLHDFEPSFSPDKIFFLERNRHLMLLQTYRWRTLLALTPALFLSELAVMGYSLLRGPRCLWGKLRAYAWMVGNFWTIRRGRRHVQSLRRTTDRALLERCTAALQLDELGQPLGSWAMAAMNPLFRIWHKVMLRVVSW